MGGMGGMGPRKDIDTESLYKELGVEKNASQEDIKRAFKKLAIKHHPDKGGDQEKFKELCKAYEILSDPEKRRNYDEYGEDGVETGGMPAGESIFEMFFGGGRQRRGPPRSDDVNSKVAFSLEEFFNGATKQMAINHNVICADCKGHGGPEDASIQCSECNGHGVKVTYQRMGPMVRQSQAPCQACRTTGKRMPADKECKTCSGRGVVRERKVIEIHLPRGAPDNHQVVFKGEADQVPGEVPGDVIFTCVRKEHDVFNRANADLIMEREISLKEALCGSGFYITCLDGTQKWIDYSQSVPITTGKYLAVENEGMPKGGSMFVRGNLFIKFTVKFPTNLTAEAKQQLLKVLPGPDCHAKPTKSSTHEADILKTIFIDPQNIGDRRGEEYDEDDMPAGGVQCRQG